MSVKSLIMSLAWSAARVNHLIFTRVLVRRLSSRSGLFAANRVVCKGLPIRFEVLG